MRHVANGPGQRIAVGGGRAPLDHRLKLDIAEQVQAQVGPFAQPDGIARRSECPEVHLRGAGAPCPGGQGSREVPREASVRRGLRLPGFSREQRRAERLLRHCERQQQSQRQCGADPAVHHAPPGLRGR